MYPANYNSENICIALGLGGFANDDDMAQAEYALRVLFKTSHEPEMCLTFIQKEGVVKLTLVAALSPVWQQAWEIPKQTPTLRSQTDIPVDAFMHLLDLLMVAECALEKPQSFTVHDGMVVHTVLRGGAYGLINIGDNNANHKAYSQFFCEVLDLAKSTMNDVNASLAFRQFRGPTKQVCRTLMLGSQEETAQIMSALQRVHAEDKSN
ncbi:hypothetical protein [Undibacterium umbellatum]|uniref:Uncharacterized protein n=1 Tax=Undibacterium umbellatum TaxID=2762300 RepID=A0ABR6Z865_9BURK|nr:hypothetical protein [Undibacterium umbellatum]MBC3907954.1 hypothetical protein [Undibacterium umbellatum]